MGYMDLALSYSNQMRIVDTPASGGGLSQNGKFSYGYASSAGKRSSMEDFFETRIDGIDGEIVGLFGVFDGHGGARAAEYVKRHLFSNLITHPKFISDTKSAIADAYNHTDSELLKSENSHTRDAGSTASTAILVGDRLLVANVGDSRAVICRGGNAFAVSRDHKPDQSDERERIENAGGFVMWAGTWRVGGVLAVSRAFGDRLLKQYVVADPEIQEEKIDDSLEFLILASDGLWDVFSNEEAVAVVKEVEDPEESTKKLVGEAIRRGSADNITCVVVRFLESKTANNNASSSSQEANQEKISVRNESDHKVSAKETNRDHTTVHSDLDHSNFENESLKQKEIPAKSNNPGPISSTQKPVAVTAAGRGSGSLEQSVVAKEKTQMPIQNESLKLKAIAAKSDDSSHISSNQKPIAVTAAGRSSGSSEQSGLVKENTQMPIQNESLKQKAVAAKSEDSSQISSTQKPIAVTAAGRCIGSSEQSGLAKENTQMPIQNESLKQQKAVAAKSEDSGHISSTQKPIAVTAAGRSSVSSEQSGLAKEKTQMPIQSGSEPNSSAKQAVQGQNTSHTEKPVGATHNNSSKQSGTTDEKDRKAITVQRDSTTSKASSVPSISN